MPSTYPSSVYYEYNLSFAHLFLYSFCTQWEGARKCFPFVKGHFHLSFLMYVFPHNVLLHNFNFKWNLSMMLFKNTLFYAREKEIATHSSILAWRIPWTKEPGGLQSVGSQRVWCDCVTTTTFYAKHTMFTSFVYQILYVSILCGT